MQEHVTGPENELSATPFKRGKVKDIYELDREQLLFVFTDRVSAYDIVLPSTIPRKGEVLCKLAAYWFNYLKVPHHMVRVENPSRMVVRKLKMIPVECVVRGYLYGSLYERLVKGEVDLPVKPVNAAKLPEPYFDPTTKSDVKDEPVTVDQILDEGWLDTEEITALKVSSLNIYKKMSERADKAGFILADLKLEFGFDEESNIVLADSIGPDEFRLWPKENYSPGKNQESYDKQLIRDWLSKVGYKKTLDEARKAGQPTPRPPDLPEDLIDETSKRYIIAYERLTGLKL
ncbi:phosphoribosylaminoimidazolesuccinocarboxamide synthase [Candidatus Bathyarchaeota archaeon]|nr:MAG: phosphoribosylaminoimidazolesuccinocarboxamide synthase [archaeon 13_1_20CM_52_20]TMI52075.1 MAG: phosphoribosylaminoimidazolesuccinocarboxamide synthase [Candidatus Bathyarchaeota archaeon]TMI59019.1 MAG: phosphoribosylaminoimidazolesuccinocarboxamide synthase [Candidatus Bathyarchaeota archaeon]